MYIMYNSVYNEIWIFVPLSRDRYLIETSTLFLNFLSVCKMKLEPIVLAWAPDPKKSDLYYFPTAVGIQKPTPKIWTISKSGQIIV